MTKYIMWSQKNSEVHRVEPKNSEIHRVRIDAGITDDATRGTPAVLCVVKATMLARLDGGAIWRPSRPTLDLARLGAPEGGLRGEALDLALEFRDLRRRGLGRGLLSSSRRSSDVRDRHRSRAALCRGEPRPRVGVMLRSKVTEFMATATSASLSGGSPIAAPRVRDNEAGCLDRF